MAFKTRYNQSQNLLKKLACRFLRNQILRMSDDRYCGTRYGITTTVMDGVGGMTLKKWKSCLGSTIPGIKDSSGCYFWESRKSIFSHLAITGERMRACKTKYNIKINLACRFLSILILLATMGILIKLSETHPAMPPTTTTPPPFSKLPATGSNTPVPSSVPSFPSSTTAMPIYVYVNGSAPPLNQ